MPIAHARVSSSKPRFCCSRLEIRGWDDLSTIIRWPLAELGSTERWNLDDSETTGVGLLNFQAKISPARAAD